MPELKAEYTTAVAKELEKLGINPIERFKEVMDEIAEVEAKRCGIDPKTVKITVTETDK